MVKDINQSKAETTEEKFDLVKSGKRILIYVDFIYDYVKIAKYEAYELLHAEADIISVIMTEEKDVFLNSDLRK